MPALSMISPMMPGMGSIPGAQTMPGAAQGGGVQIPGSELQGLQTAMPGGLSGMPRTDLPQSLQTGSAATTPMIGGSGQSFVNMLNHFVNEVNAKQATAGQTVQEMQAGGNVSLHQAVIAMEEASVSFQLMVEVRNKLLESYQELMRMQI